MTGTERAKGLAHELWTLAQLATGEGIEDGVARIEAVLAGQEARPASLAAGLRLDLNYTLQLLGDLQSIAHGSSLRERVDAAMNGMRYVISRIDVDESFQQRVAPWMRACFGPVISADTIERNHRFLEEALELVQACGCTQSEAHQLVDYVYGRPVGEKVQEVGGVMVTLAALCLAQGIDMHRAGNIELTRIWGKVEAIRAKQAAKPKHSPLPGPSAAGGEHVL